MNRLSFLKFSGACVIAALNSPREWRNRADILARSSGDVQAALNAGGLVYLAPGVYEFTRAGVTSDPPIGYCLKIDETMPAVTLLGSGWDTVLKMAGGQPQNTSLLLVRGKRDAKRAAQTLVMNLKLDGNARGQMEVSNDFAVAEVAYADDATLDTVKIVDAPVMCGRAFRKSERARFQNCHIDASNGATGIRTESRHCWVTDCHFAGTNTINYRALLDIATNADVDTPSEFVTATGNHFERGRVQIALGGARHCIVRDNILTDSLDPNGRSIVLSPYNAIAGKYSVFGNVVSDNMLYNVRAGITLSSTDETMRCYENVIRDNVIRKGPGINLAWGVKEFGAFTTGNVIESNIG